MAHFVTHFSFFLILVILSPSPQTEARFSKFYDELPKLPFQSPSPPPIINEISQPPSGISPSPSPIFEGDISPSPFLEGGISEAPSPIFEGGASPPTSPPSPIFEGVVPQAPMQSKIAPTPVETVDNAYGLYGSSDFSNEVFNKKTTEKSTNNVVDVDDNRDDEDDDFPNTNSFNQANNYNQNGYSNIPSNNNYFKNSGFSEKYNDNNNEGVNYNDVPVSSYNNRGYNDNYNANGFAGRQGMSDTRFMENGMYYNDFQIGNKNQNDGNNGRYYGDRTKYEFDSMDEYEREQGYPDNEKYYVP